MNHENGSVLCPQCKASMPVGIVFCTRCGKSLEVEMVSIPEKVVSQTDEAEEQENGSNSGPSVVTVGAGTSSLSLGMVSREVEYLDRRFPWNLIALGCVWVFLFLTYFI